MNNNENFVAYEYKDITVRRDSAALYKDCLENFGWIPVEKHHAGYGSNVLHFSPANIAQHATAFANMTSGDSVDAVDMVTLKFKRDRRLNNKRELEKLERQWEEALAAIHKLEKRNQAQTMGISLGTGIIGTGFLALAVYNFIMANVVLGVVFAIIGMIGWGIGFFANRNLAKRKAAQSEAAVQAQLDLAYSACEQAHALLAS